MKKISLSKEQKKALLKAARITIKQMLTGKKDPAMPALDADIFGEKYGLFVTITNRKQLRGCIGYIEGIKSLREAVKDLAIQAAFNDPRFEPVTKSELGDLEIEISVLYPLEEVKNINEIQVGKHGLVMERGFQKGLLLPQVAKEYNWSREEFMNQTCRKSGMENYCWENGAKIYKFEAEVFNEKELGI